MIQSNNPISKLYGQLLVQSLGLGGVPAGIFNSAPTAEAPSQNIIPDLVSGAMEQAAKGGAAGETAPILPIGAKAQITGGAGGSGFAHGLGQALGNLYNSRVARSEYEADLAAKKADMAAKQAADDRRRAEDFQRDKELILFKEDTPTSKLNRENIQSEIDSRKVRDARMAARGSGGGSGRGGTSTDFTLDEFMLQDLQNAGVDITLPEKELKKIYIGMQRKAAGRNPATTGGGKASKKFYADGSYVDYSDPTNPKFVKAPKEYSPQQYINAAEAARNGARNILGSAGVGKPEDLAPEDRAKYDEYVHDANYYSSEANKRLKGNAAPPSSSKPPAAPAAPPASAPPPSSKAPQIPAGAVIKVDENGRRYYEIQ